MFTSTVESIFYTLYIAPPRVKPCHLSHVHKFLTLCKVSLKWVNVFTLCCLFSCLGNPMDRGAWQAAVHRVAKESDTT